MLQVSISKKKTERNFHEIKGNWNWSLQQGGMFCQFYAKKHQGKNWQGNGKWEKSCHQTMTKSDVHREKTDKEQFTYKQVYLWLSVSVLGAHKHKQTVLATDFHRTKQLKLSCHTKSLLKQEMQEFRGFMNWNSCYFLFFFNYQWA
jgi:hypothetical protein